ncbi:cytochrome p450 [Phialemonium atrogriseum]|uniref:Cytochrome p450 n=1 Tax=Phialemonium atrogriseum TaxID=1093897 RepID=A0AAJ0FIL6_9PEZI|nr:cytochrome p450 [Phialemonium atrogriseum]KAK1762225.1 cytochrome p450 [Phialemonium atrogriseum]
MLTPFLLAAIPLLVVYLIREIHYRRFKQHADLPQLQPSFIWGHLKAFNEFLSRGSPDRHVDYVFTEIKEALGNPSVVFLDLRPVSYLMCIINGHEVAEQISRSSKLFQWSTPKSPTLADLQRLTGPESLLNKEGEEWKTLRRRFNPGFAPQHLMTLLPCVLDKTWYFLGHLDSYARTGEVFGLDELCTNLTFDIIGAVTMDVDFDAQLGQSRQSEFIDLYRKLILSYSGAYNNRIIPLNLRTQFYRWRLSRRIDQLLQSLIQQKFAEQRQLGSSAKSRSVLSLSLQDTETLTPALVRQTCDQLKTFLFAGHDTTSILLQWVFYELSRTPRALAAVRAELDDIFGPDSDPAVVRARLLAQGDEATRRMTYTSAVIKETLRLYPPAGTARMAPPGSGMMVRLPETGAEVCLDGIVLYNCATIVQRDRAVFGDSADDFVPERWLGNTDTSMSTNGGGDGLEEKAGGEDGRGGGGRVPASAWRPFERGPRNCIGQELANLEARVILACVLRRYDFVKVGLGESVLDEKGLPVVNGKGQYEVKAELYSTNQITSKPVDGTKVRVKLSPTASGNLS